MTSRLPTDLGVKVTEQFATPLISVAERVHARRAGVPCGRPAKVTATCPWGVFGEALRSVTAIVHVIVSPTVTGSGTQATDVLVLSFQPLVPEESMNDPELPACTESPPYEAVIVAAPSCAGV